MTQNVTELSDEKEFESFTKKGFVVVDFFADWCGPCHMMAPVMEKLSIKLKGKINFGKIDIDANTKLAQKFQVFSIPNFILFKDGEMKERIVGAMPSGDFEEKLRKHL